MTLSTPANGHHQADDRLRLLLRAVRLLPLALLLAGCGSTGGTPHLADGAGGIYKVGKPYQVAGVWYYPREDENYDATGIGSWYGPNFHGNRTANGEIFDQETLTAAHPTLPMPVLVRVTNLDNGKSLIVRVNDRGPFVAGREIDLSHKAAELLGYDRIGTARVRVQYVGRAPLPGQPGTYSTQVAGGPETFTVPKPITNENENRVAAAAPVASVVTSGNLAPPPGTSAAPAQAPLPAPAYPQPSAQPSAQGLPDAFPAQPLPANAPEEAKAAAGQLPSVQQVPVPPVTNIYVQAGAFRNLNNAQVVRQKLAAAGMPNAQVSQTMLDGSPIYRVRVGPLANVDVADGTLQRVLQNGHAGARIVVQ